MDNNNPFAPPSAPSSKKLNAFKPAVLLGVAATLFVGSLAATNMIVDRLYNGPLASGLAQATEAKDLSAILKKIEVLDAQTKQKANPASAKDAQNILNLLDSSNCTFTTNRPTSGTPSSVQAVKDICSVAAYKHHAKGVRAAIEKQDIATLVASVKSMEFASRHFKGGEKILSEYMGALAQSDCTMKSGTTPPKTIYATPTQAIKVCQQKFRL